MIDNLFDDDILINDDSTSVFTNTEVESLTNLINSNIDKVKKNTRLCLKGDGYDVWRVYIDETRGMGMHNGYFDCFSYNINNPYSVTLNIKSLNGFKYHNRRTNYRLGIIDITMFKQIPNVTNIELEPIYEDETIFNNIVFMPLLRSENKAPDTINKEFIDNLKYLEETRSLYQIKNKLGRCVIFQSCIFESESIIKYLNDNLPKGFKAIICHDCDVFVHFPEMKNEHIPQSFYIPIMRLADQFNELDKIVFYQEPIFRL